MKMCSKCKIEKDESEFSKHKRSRDGFRSECKACVAAYWSNYYTQHKSERTEYQRTRREQNSIAAVVQRLRCLSYWAFKRVNTPKTSKTLRLLGCTGADLLSLWGVESIPEGYHIDHVVPLAQAKSIEEAEKLCHYRNLRLLPAEENLAKSDNRTPEGEALCLALLGRPWID